VKKIEDTELVNMTLNGFSISWENFVKGNYTRENLPSFETLWNNCIQKETRMESKASKNNGDDNLSLLGQTKGGGEKGPSKGKGNNESTSQPGKDLSKIKCEEIRGSRGCLTGLSLTLFRHNFQGKFRTVLELF
jgi:hypothetical protein